MASTSTLALEITEDKLMTGDRLHKYTLLALRQMGVEVYIDDFGTGYSSISYLRQLPVAGVKIDKSLVDDADTDPPQEKLLMAVSYLIEACELECVVEGVETRGQADKLRSMGFECAQGYLFGKPMSSEAFTRRAVCLTFWQGPAVGLRADVPAVCRLGSCGGRTSLRVKTHRRPPQRGASWKPGVDTVVLERFVVDWVHERNRGIVFHGRRRH